MKMPLNQADSATGSTTGNRDWAMGVRWEVASDAKEQHQGNSDERRYLDVSDLAAPEHQEGVPAE